MVTQKTLYLHIGTHKTGTTSVQTYLWENRHELRKLGIDYPEVGLSGITHADFVNGLNFPRRSRAIKLMVPDFEWQNSPYEMQEPQSNETVFDELARYVEQSSCASFVMSSECFYEWTDPAAFSKRFGAIFDDIYIVVYLRPQLDWIASVYNQLIKDDFFRYARCISELPQLALLEYDKILQEWAAAFGEKSLIVRAYHSGGSFNVILDFLGQIGANSLLGRDIGSSTSVFDNKSIPQRYIGLLKALNSFPVSESHRNQLLELFLAQAYDDEDRAEASTKVDVAAIAKVVDLDNTKLFARYFKGHNPWLNATHV